MSQLEQLKLRLDITDDSLDSKLEQILEDAKCSMLDYCNRSTLPQSMLSLQRELAIVYYNRSGYEGIQTRSEGAISTSYSLDIPTELIARMKAYRLLKLVRK